MLMPFKISIVRLRGRLKAADGKIPLLVTVGVSVCSLSAGGYSILTSKVLSLSNQTASHARGADHSNSRDRPQNGLVFRSGFEPGSFAVLKQGRAKDIRGVDRSLPSHNSWDQDLQPGGRKFWINYVDYDRGGGNPRMLGANIVPDPEGGQNNVFHTWQKDAEKQDDGPYSRIQGELDQLFWKEFYYKVRFRLSRDIAKVNQSANSPYSLSLVECFTGSPGHQKLARIILQKPGRHAPLTWRSEVINSSQGGHSLYRRSQIEPEYDRWQTLEFYIRSGNSQTGRYWVRLNESQVLFNERTAITDPSATRSIVKGTILKSYGGKLVKEVKRQGGQVDVWFDDLEIWDRLPDSISLGEPASK